MDLASVAFGFEPVSKRPVKETGRVWSSEGSALETHEEVAYQCVEEVSQGHGGGWGKTAKDATPGPGSVGGALGKVAAPRSSRSIWEVGHRALAT